MLIAVYNATSARCIPEGAASPLTRHAACVHMLHYFRIGLESADARVH